MDGVVLREHPNGVSLEVRVTPRAPRTRVVGAHAGALKVALAAPPVDGAANDALVELVARLCGVPRGQVEIVRGESSRTKAVLVRGVDLDTVARGLKRG